MPPRLPGMRRRLSAVLIGLLLLSLGPALAYPTPAAAAVALPGGFRLVTEVSGQAALDLTDFAILPGGAKYTIGKSGKVAWISPDQTMVRTVAQLPAYARYDVGLIGIQLAPDYPDTGGLYLIYTRDDANGHQYGRVSRFTADDPANPTALSGETVIVDGVSEDFHYHGPGSVITAPDGTLYASFGDEASFTAPSAASMRAQDIDDPHGKILRFDAQGRGLPTNPFYDAASPSSWRSRVFARGLRNPTRFSADPRTGRLYIGDVGWNKTEELDIARGGENFGWPCYDGNDRTAGHENLPGCQAMYAAGTRQDPPRYSYPHDGAGAAVIGGLFYGGTSYPAAYHGRYFFADYAQQVLRVIGTDIDDAVTSPGAVFGTGVGAPVAIHPQANGDLTFADIVSGTIRRLRYEAGNRPPDASATATNDPDTLTVTVDASASSDLDGDPLTVSVDFGDGTPAVAGSTGQHRYAAPGTYPVTVAVTDSLGARDSLTLQVKPANHTPKLELTAPPPGKRWAVGSVVSLTATASDAENGPLTPRFEVVLRHCPYGGTCHTHPDTAVDGNSFSTEFTDHGGDTLMAVTVSATDRDGATVSEVYEALPDLRRLDVTSPVPVLINSEPATGLTAVAGQTVTVSAPLASAGRQFQSWSDGGAATHTVTMPARDLVLTASYLSEIDSKYAQSAGARLGPPAGAETALTSGAMAGGRYRLYQHGVILWSRATGAHSVQYALYQHYWTGTTPALYGFPVDDEVAVPGGYASYFEHGREYWSGVSGAHFVKGAILQNYLALGGPAFGFPVIDEGRAADGHGYYSHFTNGRSIFWHPFTGAHDVRGAIRARWAALSWERGCLGYPATGELRTATGYQNNFQHGWIVYNSRTGATTHRCT